MTSTILLLHGGCAVLYVALAGLILVRSWRSRTGQMLAGAALITAAWSASVAIRPDQPLDGTAGALDLLRSVAWYVFILHLYRRTLPNRSQLGQVFSMMGCGGLLVIGVTVLIDRPAAGAGVSLLSAGTAARLGLAVCNILLIENLYQNVPDEAKWYINLPCIALGGLFVFDIVLSADAVLFRQVSPTLLGGRAAATAIVAPLLAVAAARNRDWAIDIHVSRSAVFHSATLVASGIFLLGLSAAGEAFRYFGATWSGVAETSLLFAGAIAVATLLTSPAARSRIRALAVDHFFSNRYDYRREWLRCIDTLSSRDSLAALPARVTRAIADVVDSPGGVLYLRQDAAHAAPPGPYLWAGSLNLRSDGMPVAADSELVKAFRDGDWIIELHAEFPAETRPPNLPTEAWLAVPLSHGTVPLGFILLAPPRAPFKLDREVFDLLRILGREVATYVAEQRATEVLTETRQLHEYGKRFAFVAHDIKNVSSQLTLLLSNAETHIANPEFQRDMLTTVRASVQKITALLRRLESPDADPPRAAILPVERLRPLVAALQGGRAAKLVLDYDRTGVAVAIGEAAFDAVATHLITNAMEASPQDAAATVRVLVEHDAGRVLVDIIDQGGGMAPDFVRDMLFRPFRTSKHGGTGIGAFQARELLRDAGGDLLVRSAPGQGTRMRMVLQAAPAVLPGSAPHPASGACPV